MPVYTFKKIFENLKVVSHGDDTLNSLADFMLKNVSNTVPYSKIPAGYTYLGQFIAHDISEDSKSDRFKADHHPVGAINSKSINNLRTPVFDLESIYGFLTTFSNGKKVITDLLTGNSLRINLGNTMPEPLSNLNLNLNKPFPNDFPRQPFEAIPFIPDLRNDENLPLAQTQIAFMKFHNAIASYFPNLSFNEVRKLTIRHYQYIILNDYLPRIVKEEILKKVKQNIFQETLFYKPTEDDKYLPLEFTAACFRMGHSMIRSSYNWNVFFNNFSQNQAASLNDLFLLTYRGKMKGTGILKRDRLPTIWLINWKWFYDIDDSYKQKEFNNARRITTNISSLLGSMKPEFKMDTDIEPGFIFSPPNQSKTATKPAFAVNSLPALDLFRGKALGLATGQEVAQSIKAKVSQNPNNPQVDLLDSAYFKELLSSLSTENCNSLSADTPLWFYILAEAEHQTDGETLGDIGSWIAAETILKILLESPFSILKDDLESDKYFIARALSKNTNTAIQDNKFGMAEMLKFIAEQNTEFDELNPLETVH